MDEEFLNRLGELMEERNICVKKLAKLIGSTPWLIQRYLDYEYNPRIYFVVKLAKVFDVSVDYLLGLTDKK